MNLALWTAALFAALTLAFHLASAGAAWWRCRPARGHLPPPHDAPPVSVVIPVCGLDNFAEQTLRSAFLLDYPHYEILFCAARADDPVVALVHRLIAAYPASEARLLVGDERISSNPKLNNLFKGWNAAVHDWIVLPDSNVLMPCDYLQRLLAARRADTGLVCSPPAGCAPDGFFAELECAFLNGYQARWQYFADTIGMGFAQGKTMSWRRADLEQAGGIRALGREVAEDAASTKIVRAAGLRVRLIAPPVRQPLGRRSAAEVWRRQSRWARLRRASFPAHFALEMFSGGLLPHVAVALFAFGMSMPPLAAVFAFAAVWYGAEMLVAWKAQWPLSRLSPLCAVLRDLILPVLWFTAIAGSNFEWRGNAMRAVEREAPAG